jgi:hypothetical protein
MEESVEYVFAMVRTDASGVMRSYLFCSRCCFEPPRRLHVWVLPSQPFKDAFHSSQVSNSTAHTLSLPCGQHPMKIALFIPLHLCTHTHTHTHTYTHTHTHTRARARALVYHTSFLAHSEVYGDW